MKSKFTAKIRQLSIESKGITIPKPIADLWKTGTRIIVTIEEM